MLLEIGLLCLFILPFVRNFGFWRIRSSVWKRLKKVQSVSVLFKWTTRKQPLYGQKLLQLQFQASHALQTIYQHQLLVLPMSMFPAIVFQHYVWQIPTGLLVYPIHSAGIHHDKCSSLSKLLPTTPAGYTDVHVSSHRLPISVCSVRGYCIIVVFPMEFLMRAPESLYTLSKLFGPLL